MGVNVELCGAEEDDDREYPWLGVSGPLVVLFRENGAGTVLSNEGDDDAEPGFCVGDYDTCWDMNMFGPLCGSVTLANDDGDVPCVPCEDDE